VPLALAAAVAAGAAGAGAALLLAGGGDRVRTVVERVTQPAVTVQQTVTQATTVEVTTTVEDQGTTAASPPPGSADGHALNDEGYARMQNGDYAGALPLLEQAVENLRGTGPADPYEGYANYNLGFTLLRLGRCDDALVSLEQAERLEPGHKDVLKALKEARKCLQRSQRGNEGG
jgi:TolA-binding protein